MADDGKRRIAVLEVDASPLRATKGRVWGGMSHRALAGMPGVSGFCLMLAHFSLLGRMFSIFFRILSRLAFF